MTMGLLDVVFVFKNDRAPMLAWFNPEDAPPPVTVRKGRSVRLKWEHSHARIDDRVYLPPESVHYAYGDCGWLLQRARITGSPYWWNRYDACTGYY